MHEIAKERGFVTLTAAAHPLKVSRDVVMVREGLSLNEMLEAAQPDPMLLRHAVIQIHGHRIDRRYWHCVYPKEGTHVEIRVLPSGGGGGGGQKNVMRTVLTLAVLAASIAIPSAIGLEGILIPAHGAFAAVTYSSAMATGIALVGPLRVMPL